MIKLGKLTDYAVVILGQLAKEGEKVSRSAHYLSGKTGVPEPTVAKVLKSLAKEKFVVSLRGSAGGYTLARPAEQISLAEIITALDGPIRIVSCVNGRAEDCKTQAICPVKGNWDNVNTVIRQALDSVKLSGMITTSCGQTHDFIRSAG